MTMYSSDVLMDKVEQLIALAAKKQIQELRTASAPGEDDHRDVTANLPADVAARGQIDEHEQEITDYLVDDYFGWLRTVFRSALDPDPDDPFFTDCMERMNRVSAGFGIAQPEYDDETNTVADERRGKEPATADLDLMDSDLSCITSATDTLKDHWDGSMVTSYRLDFADPLFPVITSNQGRVAVYLSLSMKAIHYIYQLQRQDLSGLVDDAMNALGQAHTIKPSDVKAVISLATTVLDASKIILPDIDKSVKKTVDFAYLAVGKGLGEAADHVPENAKVRISGDNVKEILANVNDTIVKITKKLAEREAEIEKDLNAAYDSIVDVQQASLSSGKPSNLLPLRPDLNATATDHALKTGLFPK